MAQTTLPEGATSWLTRSLAERCRAEIEATGLGPVEIRRAPDGPGLDCLLDVRIGPFRRIATSEAEVRALLEERQACYF